jgi:chromosome segregation ATPase
MTYREEAQIAEAIAVMEWMKDTINDLENDKQRLEGQVADLTEENDDLSKEVEELKDRIDKLENQ